MWHYSTTDQFLIAFQKVLLTKKGTEIPSPSDTIDEAIALSDNEKKLSACLMRVNHTGEICAQALYIGQAFVAKDETTRAHLLNAADEEANHLAWCENRLQELNSHTSILNIGFFTLSVVTGMIAGLASDKVSLGFIAETERQVAEHLDSHLKRLPEHDLKSRAIVTQMKIDEIMHQNNALSAGGETLPEWVQWLMQLSAKIMTKTTHYI